MGSRLLERRQEANLSRCASPVRMQCSSVHVNAVMCCVTVSSAPGELWQTTGLYVRILSQQPCCLYHSRLGLISRCLQHPVVAWESPPGKP